MNTNQDIEKLAFFHVINTPDLLRNYKGEFWESPQLQKLFDIIKPHIVEFQEVPTFAQTLELVKINDAEDVLPQVYLEQLWTFASRKGEYADRVGVVVVVVLVGSENVLGLVLVAEVVLAEEDTRHGVDLAIFHVIFPQTL